MGEKIRDIKSIRIGKSSLMVELNEGYSASQGHLIHVQNNKFRYLLTENDFYHLSAMIMRAWCEFSFIKQNPLKPKDEAIFKEREEVSQETRYLVKDLAMGFNAANVDYRVLDVQNKLITFMIKEDHLQAAKSFLGTTFKQYFHPLGVINKYHFLYQMKEFLMYKKDEDDVFIEIYCQLPCASITPKTWIPLDKQIQSMIWTRKKIIDNVDWVDTISQYIFHLCWAVFFNNGFSPFSKSFLVNNMDCLDDEKMTELLSLVFFNYTSELKEHLRQKDFNSIIPKYYSFVNY